MVRRSILALAAACLSGPAFAQPAAPPALDLPPNVAPAGACAPPKLFRTTVRNISPGLQAAAHAAQPRTIWRQGAMLMRTEEGIDPTGGGQGLVIVAEPDLWVINQVERTGRHAVDQGPEFVVKAPILPVGVPAALLRLEFGCELEFLAEFAPVPERELPWGGGKALLHRVVMDEHSIAFLIDARRKVPLMVSYVREGRPVVVFRYDEYRHGLPDRPQLFAPDKNIRITEAPRRDTRPGPGADP